MRNRIKLMGPRSLDLPEGWDVFLSRALDKDPVHRYPDAARMIEALQELDFCRESRP